MPSSFSRLLDDDELAKVRELYLESLAALEAEELQAEELQADTLPTGELPTGQPAEQATGVPNAMNSSDHEPAAAPSPEAR